MNKGKNVLIGCLCAVGCEVLFGFSYLFTKNATNTASAFALLGWRFLIALAVMGVCVAAGLIHLQFQEKNRKPLLSVALLSPVIYFMGETFGISQTTASESGAFLACIPVASVVASALVLRKQPTRQQLLGILITFTGVLVTVFAAGSATSFSLAGYGMLTVAVIAYALYSVCVEKARAYTGEEITFAMLVAGALAFISAALLEAVVTGTFTELLTLPLRNTDFLVAVLYQGIGCSVLAFFLANVAITKIGVNRTASFIGVATVVSIVAGVLVLHEPFTSMQMAGTVAILCGVYIANAGRAGEEND